MIVHVKLYCRELNEQYSMIWNTADAISSTQTGGNNGNNGGIIFINIEWKLYVKLMKNKSAGDELTFNSRINVLKLKHVFRRKRDSQKVLCCK